MKFFMFVPGMRADGYVMENLSLGGSESAALYMARELVRRGHVVRVFSNTPGQSVWDGVEIQPIGQPSQQHPMGENFEVAALVEPHDVLIVQRVPQPFPRVFNSKLNLFSMHDLARVRSRDAFKSVGWNCHGVLAVSEWHRQQIMGTYKLKEDYVHVIRNGIDLALFEPEPNYERKFRGKKMVYLSRPERGLVNLVKEGGIMEKLAEIDPEITLAVCGYDNTTPEMEPLYRELLGRCHALPNVEILGHLNKMVLSELLRDSAILAYPVVPKEQHEETSCIGIMEAQAAGAVVIAHANGAIPETFGPDNARRGALIPEGDTDEQQRAMFTSLVECQFQDFGLFEGRAKAARAYALKTYGWAGPAEELESLVGRTLHQASNNVPRLVSHFLASADIAAVENMKARSNGNFALNAAQEKEMALYDYRNSDDAYRSQYDESAAILKEAVGDGMGTPDECLARPEYAHCMQLIQPLILRGGGHILDYGCGRGEFAISLAEKYPEITVYGADIASENLRVAIHTRNEREISNCHFEVADSPNSVGEDALHGGFDLIFCSEVIEHVQQDPAHFAAELEKLLAPDGRIILTFPGTAPPIHDANEGEHRREHVRHLEHADVLELWSHKPGFDVRYFPMNKQTRWGSPVSGCIVTWLHGNEDKGAVAWDRKLEQQNPAETLSVCIICRHDEPAIERTLRSVEGVAHEIIIGVDGTGERKSLRFLSKETAERPDRSVRQIGEEYGAQVFSLDDVPLVAGFAAARNEVVAKAMGDWIMWIDADEELVYGERLPKYLRRNAYDAYGVPHHHYSAEPAQVLKTDFPCRLFRRDAEFQFHGLVHEHPSKTVDTVPEHVMVIGEGISISHSGYTNDEVRRRRFDRNWPLMKRDREENPGRSLGEFLYLRDLMHMARFEINAKGGVTDDARKYMEETVEIFRKLMEQKEIRFCKESLIYVTEAVRGLTGGHGVGVRFLAEANTMGVGDNLNAPAEMQHAIFINTEDAQAFMEMMAANSLEGLKEAYL